jgi:predicted subunit of tRNA(5-methylaminomethyl-2-thiouridylate) methyltransferase
MTYGFSYSELMQALAMQKAEIAASPEAASKLVDDLGIRDIYENAENVRQHLTIQVAIVDRGIVRKATEGLALKGYPHHEYSRIDSRGIEIIPRKLI